MPKFICRMSCDYWMEVEAENHEAAEIIAEEIPEDDDRWYSSWSTLEVEEEGGEE